MLMTIVTGAMYLAEATTPAPKARVHKTYKAPIHKLCDGCDPNWKSTITPIPELTDADAKKIKDRLDRKFKDDKDPHSDMWDKDWIKK